MKKNLSFLIISLVLISTFSAIGKSGKINWRRVKSSKLLSYIHHEDLNKAVRAVHEIGRRKDKKQLQPLMQQLLLGHPPLLTREMIVTLGKIADPKAFKTLKFYTSHRNADIRVAAMTSIVNLNVDKKSKLNKKIDNILLKSLRDYSQKVRGKAAWYLGKRKVYEAEEPLLNLFKMGSSAAISSLGFIGGISTAKAFAIRLEDSNTKKSEIVNAIGTLLLRKDFGPEPVRVQLVKILGRINLPGAQTVLLRYSGSGLSRFQRSRKLAYKILSK